MNRVGSVDLQLEIQPCPLCGSSSFTPLARHDRYLMGITTVGCNQCGLVQTNPRPNLRALNDFYRFEYRRFYQGMRKPNQAYIAALHKDVRLQYTADYFVSELDVPPHAVVLDFGCGEGSLFAAMRKAGLAGEFYGIELNAEFGQFASELGNATVFNQIKSPQPVDLLIINHVLEHLLDPVGTLKEVAELLSPSGRIYIDVPDVEEYASINDLHLAHLLHFSARTLRQVASAAELVVQKVEKHKPPHHPASVRLVAARDGAARPPEMDVAQERRAWAAVESAGRFRNTLRLRLGRIGPLRAIYRSAKRVLKSS